MAHLTMHEITSGGRTQRRYRQLVGGRLYTVVRPSSGSALSGIGSHASTAATGDCGPAPDLQPGERSKCCPGVGWVIYDGAESTYNLCSRAGSEGGGHGSEGGAPSGSSSISSSQYQPGAAMERVEAMRRRIDERRMAQEEQRFERQKEEIKLRFIMGQMQAVQAKESRRVQAKLSAEAARRKAKAKIIADRERREMNKKLAIGGGVAVVAAKIMGFI